MKPQPTPLARDNSKLPASLQPGGWGVGDSPATQSFKAVLVGNPNVGKTTLYNAMVRARRPTGNYPGVTVEQASAQVRLGSNSFELLDLPGTYSLADNSPEGRNIQNALTHEEPAAIINVTDATQLERHLYLTAELLELGRPVVVALNFWDLALEQGLIIDDALLSRLLGVPVVPTIGRTGVGIELLLTRVAQACHGHAQEPFPETDRLREQIAGGHGEEAALTSASQRYDYVKRLCARVVSPAATIAVSRSERIDRVLMDRWLGLPIFGLIMYLVFQLTFTVAQPLVGGMEASFAWLQAVVSDCWHPTSESALRSLLVDGMIGGVGGVAVFVPNLLLLFLCLALLEQSGYMVRAMFVLDRLFHRFGVSGKSFIPMLIGFGCTVPAIMATRTLGTREDRLTTILVLPLISCSARLPIYLLIISAFFPNRYQAPILWAVYMTGILLAIAVGRLIRFSLFKGASSSFIMEVPPSTDVKISTRKPWRAGWRTWIPKSPAGNSSIPPSDAWGGPWNRSFAHWDLTGR